MKVEVAELDPVRKKVDVLIAEEDIKGLRERISREIRREANIKGFRPGKAPLSIINSLYREQIEDELKRRMIDTTLGEALSTAKVFPVVEPVIRIIEEDGRFGYTMECEVVPEIELPEYRGIEVEVEPIKVTDEDVETRIENLREIYSELVSTEPGYEARKDDFLIIRYEGYVDGEPAEGVKSESYPVELGRSALLPEFENELYGMKAGDEKEITVNFPEDYPDRNFAGKTMVFKVSAKEIKQKRRPELNDEFAKDLNYKNLEALKEGVKGQIEKEREAQRRQYIYQKIMEYLIDRVDIPVPGRLHRKRVEAMLEDARLQFNVDAFTEEERKKFEERFRKDYEKKAEERIKTEILLSKISLKEGITVDDEEVYERIKKIAMETGRSFDEIKGFYERNNYMEGLRFSIINEKTLDFLKDNAIIKERQS